MNINEVIKYPVLTEKSEIARTNQNVYTFVVDKRTNKIEVKKAVEFIFDVKVKRVNIINYDKKPAKLGRFAGFTNAVKKAIVYLDENSKIVLFAEEANEAKKAVENEAKTEKVAEVKEISEAEKKAAEKIKKAAEAKAKKAEEK
ncbi:50S ribosomal protein L23 [Mycoplasmopsis arginini]|uniref:Large ribosomal subunit protein uL23 n=1 Tax=Mycoplasmopsis arginini TaxID=2094 RepID=A0ABZ2AIW0_MYCAR|nr:50S ribosomal protein L23 [Mycoplasmopsis arginini]CRH54932.1 50S ribosomal protein L23 [Chlamydia trachomatis]ENY69434.1 50S ribosomal protein L23 [Mycoplasmopsis arginini 7264]MCY2903146.1 50S ribosomal protein L23 [Mycoplasmopsis arginini QMP CG1-2758]MDI3348197.1 50S ribosomal protein L23 [Mycoplasmopsis arginini]MDI3348868.1 50S ribosomal protein L23 [Mycoplasmopsis arginini]